ncbi:MAG: TIGR02270 family protein [Gammaproteobacteria bacterium]|nr:TIGR02270 family protein [Gammaproteobacteria bacterium]
MSVAAVHQDESLNVPNNKMNAYRDIYEQYVEQASFLWILRSIAVEQPHYNAADLLELEQRIEAQLDGLMTAVEDAWDICVQALELEEPGEVFTAAVIAFRSHDVSKIQKVIEVGLANDETVKGLISAMGWLPGELVHPWINKFLTSKDLNHKYLALAACSVRRENPGEYLNKILERDDCKQHEKLYARALRLIGELRRLDLMSHLSEALSAEQKDIKFWSNWSAILLGNRAAASNLETYVFNTGVHQVNAINIAFRVLPIEQARSWISKLAADQNQNRSVIQATGVLGDPHAVNWLVAKMRDPLSARLAAESFTYITGLDLEQNKLVAETPPAISAQPNDETDDDDVSLDEDENLPWPDPEKVSSIWMRQGQSFISGQRYFMGKPITVEWLNNKLVAGTQRQRHASVIELALSDSTSQLVNTRARVQL